MEWRVFDDQDSARPPVRIQTGRTWSPWARGVEHQQAKRASWPSWSRRPHGGVSADDRSIRRQLTASAEEQRFLQTPRPDSAGNPAVSARRAVIVVTLAAILVGSAACVWTKAGRLWSRPRASRDGREPVIAQSGDASEAPEHGLLVMENPVGAGCWNSTVGCPPMAAQMEARGLDPAAPELPAGASQTVLTAACGVGDTEIEVASTEGFHVGNLVLIRSSSNWEMKVIAGLGSMILGAPLSNGYPVGSMVTRFREPSARLAETAGMPIASTTTVSVTSASMAASINTSTDTMAATSTTVTTAGSTGTVTGTGISNTSTFSLTETATATPSTTASSTQSKSSSVKAATTSLEAGSSTRARAAEHGRDSHDSLWCTTVMISSKEKMLLQIALSKSKGIFQCDGHAVYSRPVMDFGEFKSRLLDADLRPLAARHRMRGFAKFWEQVLGDGDFRRYDWTVKVHPDAVFLPARLRSMVAGSLTRRGRSGSGVLINSCRTGVRMPIEVLSTRALQALAAGRGGCKSEDQENVYLLDCMDKLGVTRVDDFEVLADKLCNSGEMDPSEYWKCTDAFPVYHPFDSAETFLLCLEVAEGANHT